MKFSQYQIGLKIASILLLIIAIIFVMLGQRNNQHSINQLEQKLQQLTTLDSSIDYDEIRNDISRLTSQVNELQSIKQELIDRVTFQEKSLTEQEQKLMAEMRKLDLSQPLHQLKESILPIQQQVEILTEQVTKLLSPVSVKPVTAAMTKPVAINPPFNILGIERRGGLTFVAIANKPARNLADIRLLELGEETQGWKLVKINNQQISFQVAGKIRTIKLNEGA